MGKITNAQKATKLFELESDKVGVTPEEIAKYFGNVFEANIVDKWIANEVDVSAPAKKVIASKLEYTQKIWSEDFKTVEDFEKRIHGFKRDKEKSKTCYEVDKKITETTCNSIRFRIIVEEKADEVGQTPKQIANYINGVMEKSFELRDIFGKEKKSYVTSVTVGNWLKSNTDLKDTKQILINLALNLEPTIWTDTFSSEVDMREQLPNYFKDWAGGVTVVKDGVHQLNDLDKENSLKNFKEKKKIDISKLDLEKEGMKFRLFLAQMLYEKRQLKEGFEVLESIEDSESEFSIKNENEVDFIKALIFDKLGKRTKAKIIFKKLSNRGYNVYNPEVDFLIGSQIKREAFYGKDGKELLEELDVKTLNIALTYYMKYFSEITKMGEKSKKYSERYYYAINVAYLFEMLNRIEDENRESASAIFRKIGWRYNPDCFWETMTQAEFLVLQNRVEEAEKVFEDYAKRKNIDEGSLQSSLDQLKAFAHFTEDESAIEFLEFLKEFAKSEL
jgi:hypothetical protein